MGGIFSKESEKSIKNDDGMATRLDPIMILLR